jgi:hypothetical protein
LQQKATAAHQLYREYVSSQEIGVLPEHLWSKQAAQGELLQRVKASLMSEDRNASLKEAQWASVEKASQQILQQRADIEAASAAEAGAKAAAADEKPAEGRKRPAKAVESGAEQSRRGKKQKTTGDPVVASFKDGHKETKEEGEGKAVAVVDAKAKIWKDAPAWLEPGSVVEVECEGEWWQAKAVELKEGVNKQGHPCPAKIKFEFVGGSEEEAEWLPIDSRRIRPSEGCPIDGEVGEKVQAKRPKDKGPLKDKWNLAEVVEVKDDDAAPQVKVRYLERRGVKDEWLPIDTVFVRKLEVSEGDDDKMQVESEEDSCKPWPQGSRALHSGVDEASLSSCLLLLEFLAAFGQTPLLMGAACSHSTQPPHELQAAWRGMTIARMLEMMKSGQMEECIADLILRLVSVLVRHDLKDSADKRFVIPNALNFLAWVKRLIQKDMLERGRRILYERIEEAYTPEYELEKAGLSRAAVNKGRQGSGSYLSNFSVKGDDMGGVEGLDGLTVEVTCSDVYKGAMVVGVLAPPADAGAAVRVTCDGIVMSLSDFALFAQPSTYTPPLQVMVSHSAHARAQTLMTCGPFMRTCSADEDLSMRVNTGPQKRHPRKVEWGYTGQVGSRCAGC